MNKTKIAWADYVWNPVIGCSHSGSPGCDNCYAKRLHDQRRKAYLEGKAIPDCYSEPFEKIRFFPERLDRPLRKKKSGMVFVCSMSDLFHEDVPFKFVDQVFDRMLDSDHTYMLLTKRPERMKRFIGRRLRPALKPTVLEKIWIGVTAENQEQADKRIPILLQIPAVHLVSVEPCLSSVDLSRYMPVDRYYMTRCGSCEWIGSSQYCVSDRAGLMDDEKILCPKCSEPVGDEEPKGISLCIVGGETGPNARSMNPEWARSLRDQCKAADVAFFMKQMSGGAAIPADLMIREFPKGGFTK